MGRGGPEGNGKGNAKRAAPEGDAACQSRGLVSQVVHGQQARRSPTPFRRVGLGRLRNLTGLSSTTNPLTATALIYALGAGITAGAGTRLVLQLLLDVGWS